MDEIARWWRRAAGWQRLAVVGGASLGLVLWITALVAFWSEATRPATLPDPSSIPSASVASAVAIPSPPRPAAKPARREKMQGTSTVYRTKEGYLFGVTEEAFERGFKLLIEEDGAAMARMQARRLIGETADGVEVVVVSRGGFIGLGRVEVRPIGKLGTVWTNSEALEVVYVDE